MNAEDEGELFTPHVLCYGLIRREHEFLDDLMGDVPLSNNDVYGLTLEVNDDLGFREVKIDTASLRPFCPKLKTEHLHEMKGFYQPAIPLCKAGLLVFKDLFDEGIGHPLIAVDDTLVDLIIDAVSLRVKQHLCCQCEAVFPRVQTADMVRELLREHRDHPVRQVDTRPP